MKQYLEEIETILKQNPLRQSLLHPESYIGGNQSGLRYLGVSAPHSRQALKKGFSFSHLSEKEIAKIWHFVWQNSDCFDVMTIALAWFDDPKRSALVIQEWPRLKQWSSRVDNWAHADGLSSLYSRILEEKSETLKTLREWNHSKNPWLRRLSIVSLLYYSKQRKKMVPAKTIFTLLEPQLDHQHYYVQKGVGWTLRECGNVYPFETYSFLEKNIQRISAHAFQAATEKLSKAQKNQLKKLRKRKRPPKS